MSPSPFLSEFTRAGTIIYRINPSLCVVKTGLQYLPRQTVSVSEWIGVSTLLVRTILESSPLSRRLKPRSLRVQTSRVKGGLDQGLVDDRGDSLEGTGGTQNPQNSSVLLVFVSTGYKERPGPSISLIPETSPSLYGPLSSR